MFLLYDHVNNNDYTVCLLFSGSAKTYPTIEQHPPGLSHGRNERERHWQFQTFTRHFQVFLCGVTAILLYSYKASGPKGLFKQNGFL